MKKYLSNATAFVLFVMLHSTSYGQNEKAVINEAEKIGEAKKSEVFEAELIGFRNPMSADLEWFPTLSTKWTKVEHSLPGKEELMAMKAAKAAVKVDNYSIAVTDEDENEPSGSIPIVGEEFNGNPSNGSSPMDNSIAISDDGIIVSVANTTIEYNTMSGTTTFASSIVDFIGDPSIDYVCDPVVLYDPAADRFIFFAQECSGNSSNSYLLVFFSQTNDPSDGWNYYKLTGNPLSDNSWFDYPKLAISDTELFITGNLFTNSGSFNESVVYQMEKNDGYAGASMTWQYWSDIPGSPGTLLVVSSGNEFNYGPGIYMVSTSPFSGNKIKFYDITDAIAGSATMDYYSVNTTAYEVAADSDQLGTGCKLDNGDCRCLSGFYLDGTIHFVFQSDVGGGWNGINYNRLNVSSLTNNSNLFGNAGTRDYSYPSVAWYGLTPSDKSVLIGFGSVSSAVYPEIRVVHVDHGGDLSATTLVHNSNSYACFTSPSVERWGDYTGIVKKHNSSEPSVWISGMYGAASNRWNTWIAEIHSDYSSGIESNTNAGVNDILIAPNPVMETFILSFEMTEDVDVHIQLMNINGQIVKDLFTGTAHPGTNNFSFNKANLASGTYFLQVIGNEKLIANEKIIIQ
jgi:hypothetical protein